MLGALDAENKGKQAPGTGSQTAHNKLRPTSALKTNNEDIQGPGRKCCVCAQSCLTLCNPMDCSPPGTCTHGVSQARTLEEVAISSSRASSRPRDWTWVSWVSCTGRWILYHCTTWETLQKHKGKIMTHVCWARRSFKGEDLRKSLKISLRVLDSTEGKTHLKLEKLRKWAVVRWRGTPSIHSQFPGPLQTGYCTGTIFIGLKETTRISQNYQVSGRAFQ